MTHLQEVEREAMLASKGDRSVMKLISALRGYRKVIEEFMQRDSADVDDMVKFERIIREIEALTLEDGE